MDDLITHPLLQRVREAAVFGNVHARIRFYDGVWTESVPVRAKDLTANIKVEHLGITEAVEVVGGPLDGVRYQLRDIYASPGDFIHVTIPQLLGD